MTEPDTDLLPYTRTQLSNAISALIDEKPHSFEDEDGKHRIEWVHSLLTQLQEAVTASRDGMNTGVAKSKPPLWLDAVDLLHEIDRNVRTWAPGPDTLHKLRHIDGLKWRPQDVPLLEQWAQDIHNWCERIKLLLSEESVKTVAAACPECDEKTVYRWRAGERIRQPALQITTKGCTCRNCHTTWAPEHFELLAAALQCEPIEGVVR